MGITRNIHHLFLGLALAIAVTPAAAQTLSAGNGIYEVLVAEAGGACGTWTARTGSGHPAGGGLNVLFGNGNPGSSNTILRSYTTGLSYTTGSSEANRDVCNRLCDAATPTVVPIVAGETTVGYRFTWIFTDGEGSGEGPTPMVAFIQEIVVEGPVDGSQTVDNTVIRETHTVVNMGPDTLEFGLRKMWDWQIGVDDGPWFGDCQTPTAACNRSMNLTADGSLDGPYPRSYVINEDPVERSCPGEEPTAGCSGEPLYVVAGTVTPPTALMPPPDAPEVLQFNAWAALSADCWQPALDDNALCGAIGFPDDDTATAYFYGSIAATAETLGPGQERSFTQYVVAGEQTCPEIVVDTDPPACSGGPSELAGVVGEGTATDDGESDSGIATVELAFESENVTLDVDPFLPAAGSVVFRVEQVDTGLPARGTVVVTDVAGSSCTVTFRTVPPGPTENEVLCRDDGILFSVSNELETPAGNAACSSNPISPNEPPLPPGYDPSPPQDAAPCTVLTIESPIAEDTVMVYKKDGDFDPRLRLLFSRFDGSGFPPFVDVTQSIEAITDVVPDPTRLEGGTKWSPVKVACAILSEICDGQDNDGDGLVDEDLPVGGPAVDFDKDGFPLCPATAGDPFDCNDQLEATYPGAREVCNGLDDDCDAVVDEDEEPPEIDCPDDTSLECPAPDPSPDLAGVASATDNCTATADFSDSTANGCGATATVTRTWTATDEAGGSAECLQTITVVDTTPPELLVPPPLELECLGAGGVPASAPAVEAWLASASALDACGAASVGRDELPALLPLGPTPVEFTAVDECGNPFSSQSTITVIDTVAPEALCGVTRRTGDDLVRVQYGGVDTCSSITRFGHIEFLVEPTVGRVGDCPFVPVDNGQIIEVGCTTDRCTVRDDGVLRIRARDMRLVTTAVDSSGNRSTCSMNLCQRAVTNSLEGDAELNGIRVHFIGPEQEQQRDRKTAPRVREETRRTKPERP